MGNHILMLEARNGRIRRVVEGYINDLFCVGHGYYVLDPAISW
jgi:hypothetical protein